MNDRMRKGCCRLLTLLLTLVLVILSLIHI